MEELERWVACGFGPHGSMPLLAALMKGEGDFSERGLTATQDTCAGDVVVALPWKLAMTADTALVSLRRIDKLDTGFLPGGLPPILCLLAEGHALLPRASAWVLLLALHLLAELRNPRSSWAPYLAILPAPPGSRIAAVCRAGPPASDLLLFSPEELQQLHCPPLAATIQVERQRLTQLHALLFHPPGILEPSVSLESFMWAHCLVRSRALDLIAQSAAPPAASMAVNGNASEQPAGSTAQGMEVGDATCSDRACESPCGRSNDHECTCSGTARHGQLMTDVHAGGDAAADGLRVQCLLPLIDLCNHDAAMAPCHIQIVDSQMGRRVELRAGRDYRQGEQLTINYGDRPLRDMLRSYGFTPDNSPMEVFEDVGSACESLIVIGSPKGSMFTLWRVHVFRQRGNDAALELQEATVCYVVKDNATSTCQDFGAGVQLVVDPCDDPGFTDRGTAAVSKADGGVARQIFLDPLAERQVTIHIAEECEHALLILPSTIEQDVELLYCHTHTEAREHAQLDPQHINSQQWQQACHHSIAIRYRLQRKQLLRRVANDLHDWALLCRVDVAGQQPDQWC